MSVSKMQRLTVIATMKDADAIVQRLMKLRAVSIEKTSESVPLPDSYAPHTDVSGAAARVARIEAALPVLSKRSKRKKKLFAAPTPISPEPFHRAPRDQAVPCPADFRKLLYHVPTRCQLPQ